MAGEHHDPEDRERGRDQEDDGRAEDAAERGRHDDDAVDDERDDVVRGQGQTCVEVSEFGAPTGFDSGDPRWRR